MSTSLVIILTALISAGLGVLGTLLVRNVILKGKRDEILKTAEA